VAEHRSHAQARIEERRAQVARHYLRGETQRQIAAKCGVSLGTVSTDIEALRAQWQSEHSVAVSQGLRKELARIDEIERTAWAEWERSRGTVRKRRKSVKDGAEGRETTRHTDCYYRLGDPRYMERISWCVEMRAKLLGLEKRAEAEKPAGLPYCPKEQLMTEFAARYNRWLATNRERNGDHGGEL
jgi:DNA-binding CsgD family transcriptional regulator